jgi:hypothetical protein
VFDGLYFVTVEVISITYSECVSVDLVIEQAMHMGRVVNCDLSGCTVFSTLSHNTISGKRKLMNIK